VTRVASPFDPSLIVPTGNVVSVFVVLVSTFVAGEGWRTRLLAIAAGVAGIVASSFVPVAWMAESPRAAFLAGFVPPAAGAALVLWIRRRGPPGATPSPRPPP
jgi:uncharacterized membrane protein YeaQ/YmgE (transglycosylase-associated protein family)